MKLSTAWLNEYLDVSAVPASTLADALTNVGLEVEGAVQETGLLFRQVVVAHVQAIAPHPNADKLRLVTLDAGVHGVHQVVCGAPNVRQGLFIAFALDGATVFSYKTQEWFTLKPAVIRGVASAGMVCSLEELALQAQYTQAEGGIWEMNGLVESSHIGLPIEQALNLDVPRDALLETAPTANRGDWMSYLGVARELAALHGAVVNLPPSETVNIPMGDSEKQVTLPDETVCTLYYGATLSGLQVQPSPAWLRQRLEASGVRSINTVVDITNYVMLETGQPLHAFDAAKLTGRQVSVRPARQGDQLQGLDDVLYTDLTPEAVVVTCDDVPVALAGVMGGLDTAINEQSTSVFLEAACFPSAMIRKSSRAVGVRTESSARFERGVDAGGTRQAFERAIYLFKTLTGASLQSTTFTGTYTPQDVCIPLRLSRLHDVIGQAFPLETVTTCLQGLGFSTDVQNEDVIHVGVPTFRQRDVQQEIDLIEEVVRIHGYHHIEAVYPASETPVGSSLRRRVLKTLRAALLGLGLNEAMTGSLMGEGLLQRTGAPWNPTFAVELSNSHSSEHTLMRQSVLPTLLDACLHNVQQGVGAFNAFELGRVYLKRGKAGHKQTGVQEALKLAIIICQQDPGTHWQPSAAGDVYALKGMIETALKALDLHASLFVTPGVEEATAQFHPGRCARLSLHEKAKPVAQFGQMHPALQKQLKLKHPIFFAELDVDALIKAVEHQQREAQATLPKPLAFSPFPSIHRDMALLVPDTLHHQTIQREIQALAPEHLQQVELFDAFSGEAIGAGHRSLAYRLTYQTLDRTLQDDEVDTTMQRIREHLQTTLNVTLR
jgi:phenylalanyl-tRNA synthetase beta chain